MAGLGIRSLIGGECGSALEAHDVDQLVSQDIEQQGKEPQVGAVLDGREDLVVA